MGADDNVDVTTGEVGEELGGLFGCASTRQVIDAHGEVLETFGEGAVVLVGEHGGGDEDGHLLAVVASLEGGTDSHFGLAEAHIAADETIHGTGRLHVALHLLCSLELVGRVFEHETGFELVLHLRVGAILEAFLLATHGIEGDEVARHVLHLLLGLVAQTLPTAMTQFGQGRGRGIVATVLRQLVELMDGDEEQIAVPVDEFDHLLIAVVAFGILADGHVDEATELGDAVIDVDDVVADVELQQLLDAHGNLARTCAVGAKAVLVEAVEDLMVGEVAVEAVVVDESLVDGTGDADELEVFATVLEDGFDAVELLGRVAEDVDGVALEGIALEVLADEVEVLVPLGLRGGVELDDGMGGRDCDGIAINRTGGGG